MSTLIEWDTHIPALDKVVAEALHAQSIMEDLGLAVAAAPSHQQPAVPLSGFETLVSPRRSPLMERHEAVES